MPTTRRSTYKQREKVVNGERMILKRGYHKKGYSRKAYTRRARNGKMIRVKAARIAPSKVKATWIKKQGLSHGKYGLIPLKDYRHLGTFGYNFEKSSASRHAALKKAIKKYGRNWAVRRLTALANVRPQLPKYANVVRKARSDVAYIENYSPSKTAIRRHKKYQPRGLARTQR